MFNHVTFLNESVKRHVAVPSREPLTFHAAFEAHNHILPQNFELVYSYALEHSRAPYMCLKDQFINGAFTWKTRCLKASTWLIKEGAVYLLYILEFLVGFGPNQVKKNWKNLNLEVFKLCFSIYK